MKKTITIILVIFAAYIYPQSSEYYYTISELNGIEDNSNYSHLFYRLFTEEDTNNSCYRENSVYHLDLSNEIDTLFLTDYTEINNITFHSLIVYDYTFWNNNPAEYIYCGAAGGDPDLTYFIKRFDNDGGLNMIAFGDFWKISISKQNDSLLYAGASQLLFKSSDGGRNWVYTNAGSGLRLAALSPFDDHILFAITYSGVLKRSTNGGYSFSTLHTNFSDSYLDYFLFDINQTTIYTITQTDTEESLFDKKYFLKVSENSGDNFEIRYISDFELTVETDPDAAGKIYMSEGNKLFVSDDRGLSFDLIKEFDRNIVDIYKKANSNIIYLATRYKIFKIIENDIVTIKEEEFDPSLLKYYPLTIGNKWVYEWSVNPSNPNDPDYYGTDFKEVIGYTTIEGKHYFIIQDNVQISNYSISYERIDSTTGKVYRYTPSDGEILIDDLLAVKGEEINTHRAGWFNSEPSFVIEQNEFNGFSVEFPRKVILDLDGCDFTYSLTKNLGLDNLSYCWDDGHSQMTLKGCVINGTVYGDTTLTSIAESGNTNPRTFVLYQNYPNPFNPTTTIKYAVGSRQLAKDTRSPLERGGRGVLTKLIVYDILGREVTTLVNELKQPGVYEVSFDGSNLSSGIYFYKLTSGSFIETKKMILLR